MARELHYGSDQESAKRDRSSIKHDKELTYGEREKLIRMVTDQHVYTVRSMSLGKRIQERMEALGLSQTELARRIGVSQPAIYALIKNNKTGTRRLPEIARELKTTPAYLSGETDDPFEGVFVPPTATEIAAEMGLVRIIEIDLNVSKGPAFMSEPQGTEVDRWIPEEWVSNFTSTPVSLLAIARATGDSMYPTINNRDLVLLDRSLLEVDRSDAIWFLVFGGFTTIRRVRMLADGSVRLMADNPQVRDEVTTASEISVIGRIAGVFRRA